MERMKRITLYWSRDHTGSGGWYGLLEEQAVDGSGWEFRTDTMKVGEPLLEGYTLEEEAEARAVLAREWVLAEEKP